MSGYGTKFWRSVDGVTFYQVTGLIEVSPPDFSRTPVDNTEPGAEYPEKKAGAKKVGDVSASFKAEGNPHIAEFYNDLNSDAARYYRIDYGEEFTVSFSGFVTKVKDDNPTSGRITRQVTISITGTPQLTYRGA